MRWRSGYGVAASLRYLWAVGLVLLGLPLVLGHTVVQLAAGLVNMAFTFADHTVAFVAHAGQTLWNWLTRFRWIRENLQFKPLGARPAPSSQELVETGETRPSAPGASEPRDGESQETPPPVDEPSPPDLTWAPLGG